MLIKFLIENFPTFLSALMVPFSPYFSLDTLVSLDTGHMCKKKTLCWSPLFFAINVKF